MKHVGLLLLSPILLLATPATGSARPAAAPLACEQTAQTQSELTACAAEGAKAADQKLNKAYRDLLRYVDGADTAKLVTAQRAWIAFRDADCAFWGAGDGSIAPMNLANCLAELSNKRAEELDTWPPNASRDALAPRR
jgi:uncharacterized protein YecT (DUF1311 family)